MLKAPVRESADFERLQPGTYQAIISNVYDIGIQSVKNMQTGLQENKQQVIVLFEINETIQTGQFAGKRFVQSRTYNFTMSKNSGLRKLVEIITGTLSDQDAAEYDLEQLRGENLTLTIAQNGEYLNIVNLGGLVKGMTVLESELAVDYIPAWISKKMNSAQAPAGTPTHADNLTNDVHENDMMEYEVADMIKSGAISEMDKNSTIQRVLGKRGTFRDMTPDQAVKVADSLKRLAEMRTVKP